MFLPLIPQTPFRRSDRHCLRDVEPVPEATLIAASDYAVKRSVDWLRDGHAFTASPHVEGPPVLRAPLPLKPPSTKKLAKR
jgi:hypothetical protein